MVNAVLIIATVSLFAIPNYTAVAIFLTHFGGARYQVSSELVASFSIVALVLTQFALLCLSERDPNFLYLWITAPTTTCILYGFQLVIAWLRGFPNTSNLSRGRELSTLITLVSIIVIIVGSIFFLAVYFIRPSLNLSLELLQVLSRLAASLFLTFFLSVKSIAYIQQSRSHCLSSRRTPE